MPITEAQITATQQQIVAIFQNIQKMQRLLAIAKLRVDTSDGEVTFSQESIIKLYNDYAKLRDLLRTQTSNLP